VPIIIKFNLHRGLTTKGYAEIYKKVEGACEVQWRTLWTFTFTL